MLWRLIRRVRARRSFTAPAPTCMCSAKICSFLCACLGLHACPTSFCVLIRSTNTLSASLGRVVGRPRFSVLIDFKRKRFDSVERRTSRDFANAAMPPHGTFRLSMKVTAFFQSALSKSATFFPGAPTAAKKSAIHSATTKARDITRASEYIKNAMMYTPHVVAWAAALNYCR